MDQSEFLNHYREKAKARNFDLSTIRKEMEQLGRTEEEIQYVVRTIDDELIEQAYKRNGPAWYQNINARGGLHLSGAAVMIFGGLIALIGVFYSVVSLVQYFGGNGPVRIFWGPLSVGGVIALFGYMRVLNEKLRDRRRR